MPRPTLRKRPKDIEKAFEEIPPYQPLPSDLGFFIPPVLESDFNNWLQTDVPGVNYTFEVVKNWYDRDKQDYDPTFIRASFFPISWKSKIGNSDMGSNFLSNTKVDIKKGDYVIREDGEIYVLDWKVQRKPNVQTSQAKDCNAMLEIWRTVPEVLDDRGYVIAPQHDDCVIPPIPCVWTSHSGRPDFAVAYNTPGINPDA